VTAVLVDGHAVRLGLLKAQGDQAVSQFGGIGFHGSAFDQAHQPGRGGIRVPTVVAGLAQLRMLPSSPYRRARHILLQQLREPLRGEQLLGELAEDHGVKTVHTGAAARADQC
jgi:hypothetical protein